MSTKKSDFTLHILGCGSAVPTVRHNPSCQIIDHRGTLYMIDCGEGAQAMMRRLKLKFSRLRHIFISHLHGDHMLGLPGLLSTLALNNVGGTITVHIMADGERVLRPLVDLVCRERSYTLEWDIINGAGGTTLIDTDSLRVTTIRLYHRVPCVGFRFDTKGPTRRLLRDMLDHYEVPVAERAAIASGADFVTADGRTIPNGHLSEPMPRPRSYAYCSDTMPNASVAAAVSGVTTLYHEATYADSEASLAAPRGHSTARQAAETALKAGVGKLILGHYSKRYLSTDTLLAEAREVFPDTFAADEGDVFSI